MVSNTSRNGGAVMIGLNRRRTMGNALPYDAEVEYLEGDGNQYIPLNLYVTANDKIEIYAYIIRISSGRCIICGNYINDNSYPIISFEMGGTSNSHAGNIRAYRKVLSSSVLDVWHTSTIPLNQSHYVAYEYYSSTKQLFIIDYNYNTEYHVINGVNSNIRTTCPLTLFSDYRSNHNVIENPIRIGKVKININDSTVVDLIPVRVGQVGYMYDRVSGQLFGNAGSGNFILGNDVN